MDTFTIGDIDSANADFDFDAWLTQPKLLTSDFSSDGNFGSGDFNASQLTHQQVLATIPDSTTGKVRL
jgi:hypothetical protein